MDSIDLENSSLRSILKQDQYLSDETEQIILNKLTTLCKLFLMLALIAPFILFDLYFAYNDNSCTKLDAGKLIVNLSDILKIDGLFHILLFIIITLLLCISNNRDILTLILKLMSTFDIAWSVLGSVIFWGLINNNLCNVSLYNYLYAKFIVVFICRLIFIFS
jgi:hypothetical protein